MKASQPRTSALLFEAITAILAKPVRSTLTAIGTTLGVATLVAVVGITQTVSAQVSESFSQADLNLVTAESRTDDAGGVQPFSSREVNGVLKIQGVERAGVISAAQADDTRVAAAWSAERAEGSGAPVLGVSPESLTVAGSRISRGRMFDLGHVARRSRVAVIGVAVARRLNLGDVAQGPTVFIGDVPFSVIGILSETQGFPDLLTSVIIPPTTLIHLWGEAVVRSSQLVVETATDAAQVVGPQVGVAARPEAPDSLRVLTPPRPEVLRRKVDWDLTSLLLVLAAVALVIGLVGIGNTTLVSVLERIPEFGLRRSLGATRSHNAVQVIAESTLLGGLGGVVGASVGIMTIAVVSAMRSWTPTLNLSAVPLAVAVGAAVGMIAGLYPAVRASSIDPDEALRR